MMIQCIIHLQFTGHKIHLFTRCKTHFLINMWSIKTLGHIQTHNLIFHLTHQVWSKWLIFSGSSNPTSTMLEKASYICPFRYRKMTTTKLETLVKTNKIKEVIQPMFNPAGKCNIQLSVTKCMQVWRDYHSEKLDPYLCP